MSKAALTNDQERLDWLNDNDNVFEFIAALTCGPPSAVNAEIIERKLDPKNLSIRDLIDMLSQHTK